MTLVESLKIMKKVSGMTTKDVADKSGVPEPTLEKIFSGATTDPKVSTMRSIVNAMGFNLDDLYKEDLDKNKKPLVSHDEELLNEELIMRLISLSPEELGRLDAFLQGLEASR